jgi:hypothetical protein
MAWLPAQVFAQESHAPDDVPVSESLTHLESALDLSNSTPETLVLRLAHLETKVFGTPQSGSLKERIAKLNQKVFASDNYFPTVMHATNNKVMRFRQLPIPVLISPIANQNYMQACIAGFERWERATEGLVRFTQVDDPNTARIKVTWSHLGGDTDATGCTLGAHTITKWQKKPKANLGAVSLAQMPIPIVVPRLGTKYSVPPQIIEVNLDLIDARDPKTRYQLLENVVAHELGHALGLLGHSPNKNDMMYSQTDENSKLTQRDINTIQKLYQQTHIDIAL